MFAIILQNANESAASGLFHAFMRSVELLLATEEVRMALGWIGALLVVGGSLLLARFLVGRTVAKHNADLKARQAQRDALDASEARKP